MMSGAEAKFVLPMCLSIRLGKRMAPRMVRDAGPR